ncbi:MAG TPA: phospholipase D family protein [Thermoanaerobaculia bacterium]
MTPTRGRVLAAGRPRRVAAGWALLLALAAPAAPAEPRARLLLAADEAAAARVELVLTAEREVFASSFIVGHEPLSMTALALLRDAARRGLDVRLLVDAQWNKMPPGVEAHLLDEGVELRVYHPFRWRRPGWLTRRLHDKLLVVDGEALIAGGRNVESPYFDLGRQLTRRDYVDADVLLRGAAAAEARDYFLALWDSRHVRPVRARADAAARRRAAAELDLHHAWLTARVAAELAAGRPESPLEEIDAARLLHDPVAGKRAGDGVAAGLAALVEGAERSLVIESPYLIPTRALEGLLRRTLARGVRVRILTNSLASTDNLWAQAGYVGERRRLVAMGVELWEYQGPESLHSKVAVIDGETAVVASFNLDPRSERLNTELALVLADRELAAELAAWMAEHLARATPIDERGWPAGAGEPFPGLSRGRRLRLCLLRAIAPLIRSQL